MNQFQRDFFLIRAAEYEPYVNALGPGLVTQGDLTDPYYLDFISFVQYLTINRVIANNPPMIFTEQQAINRGDDQPNNFINTVVRRDPTITNDKLILEHDRRVGLAILQRLDETFQDTSLALPRSMEKTNQEVRSSSGECEIIGIIPFLVRRTEFISHHPLIVIAP